MSKRIYSEKVDARMVLERVGKDPAKLHALARKAGLDPGLLDKWVAGKVRLSGEDQAKIARALG